MAPGSPLKAPAQPDVRAAKQLLGLLPFMGQLWSTAVREGGAGSIGRFKTLGALHGHGPVRAGELASRCGTTPSAMSEVIEGLAEDGFVRRVDDPTDRRAVMIALTAAGDAELERVAHLLTGALLKIFEGLTAEQKTRLRAAVADIDDIIIAPSAHRETRSVR
ncbi:MAG: MarR family winged helix-turn-helix transcriptional regulator [Candidatus Limnocylindria bacterium]